MELDTSRLENLTVGEFKTLLGLDGVQVGMDGFYGVVELSGSSYIDDWGVHRKTYIYLADGQVIMIHSLLMPDAELPLQPMQNDVAFVDPKWELHDVWDELMFGHIQAIVDMPPEELDKVLIKDLGGLKFKKGHEL